MTSTTDNPPDELVVVTGASTGIGLATAQRLAADGFQVLAGVRTDQAAEAVTADRIEAVRLDITESDQVAAVAERVRSDPAGRPLRALVNNAGIAVVAPVELIPVADWRHQFEANLFGHVAMIQTLLPALIAARGRVINISSIGGLVAGPTYGAYSASKFGLEAMSDALRREVGHLGVQVVVVQPGGIATPIWTKGLATAERLTGQISPDQRERYGPIMAAADQRARQTAAAGISPDRVAEVIATAITTARPRTRYLVGRDAQITARIVALLPDRWLDRMVGGRNVGGRAGSADR